MEYTATAVMTNGERYEAEGTIMQMANWADNIIRLHEETPMTIEIQQKVNEDGR